MSSTKTRRYSHSSLSPCSRYSLLIQLPIRELDPAFQTKTRKYLKDIYYNTDKIEKFKVNCIEKQEQLRKKITDLNIKIKEIKAKIKDSKQEKQEAKERNKELVSKKYAEVITRIRDEARLKLESIYQR